LTLRTFDCVMFLKKIEIQGFKSFANKTTVVFDRGMTAVVGPNGSGKSNIADAIKWVLGEQSVKSLRGKKGEDVIFAGSEKKARVSAASVFLYFDNSDGDGAVKLNEIVIGRKVFRDGTSQYSLNESRVRLSDVVNLLTESGIGKGEYTVINQGMADAILNASSAQRKMIFEDAIGIRHFRIKRDQADKKLESTRQNMIRISDVVAEIEPRLKTLKRQAQRAEKKEELDKELRDIQEQYYFCKMAKLLKSKEKFNEQEKILNKKIKEAQDDLENAEKKLQRESKEELEGGDKAIMLRKNLQEFSDKRRRVERSVVDLEGRIKFAKRTIEEKTKELQFVHSTNQQNKDVKKENEKIILIKEDLQNLLSPLKKLEKIDSVNELRSMLKNVYNFFEKFLSGNKIKNGEIDNPPSFSCERTSEDRGRQYCEKAIQSAEAEKLEAEGWLKKEKQSLDMIEKEVANCEKDLFKIDNEDRKRRSNFFELEKAIRQKRNIVDEIEGRMNQLKVENSGVLIHVEDLTQEILAQLSISSYQLSVMTKNVTVDDMKQPDVENLDKKIRKIKGQLEQIGGTDDLTIQEYAETQERFDNFSCELEDLESAKNNLISLIQKTDKEMENKFKASFKNIAKKFDQYFKMIFGGGEAKIFYDSEESGIEIGAVPPGKKTKNLTMLSGGERALTSIAILAAIIANNPPPFCVLDEVDAALDEANSLRIGRVFADLVGKTQFIVITHNRAIMNQSNILYGVTMQKDGVSQLLSVRLDGN